MQLTKSRLVLVTLGLLLLAPLEVWAQEPAPFWRMRWVPPRLRAGETHVLFKARYANESKFGAGAAVLRRFVLPGAHLAPLRSEVRVQGLITQRASGRAQLRIDLVPSTGVNRFRARADFDNIRKRFWGLGPDSRSEDEEVFQAQSVFGYVELLRRFGAWEVGVRAEAEEVKYLETEPGGLLDTRGYRGLDGDAVVGVGAVLNIDTRDRRDAPTRGTLIEVLAMGFPAELGSQLSFHNQALDVRHYTTLPRDFVLASQFFTYSVRGGPPIWRYAAVGGRAHTRGYRSGRFLDRMMMSGQLEVRSPVWWRVGFVGFGGLAAAAPSYSDLSSAAVRPTVGGGVRLKFTERDDVIVRLDFAVGQSSLRVYLGFGDSF